MVDWGKYPPLSSTAAPSANVDQTAGINSSWRKRSGLGLAPGPRSAGGDGLSLILCSDISLFLDNLKLSPVFMLSGMDFQDTLGSSADSFANLASGLNRLPFLDTLIEVDVVVAVPWARVHVGQFAAPFTNEPVGARVGPELTDLVTSWLWPPAGLIGSQGAT